MLLQRARLFAVRLFVRLPYIIQKCGCLMLWRIAMLLTKPTQPKCRSLGYLDLHFYKHVPTP